MDFFRNDGKRHKELSEQKKIKESNCDLEIRRKLYRYDYPATVRVSVKNGELQKVLEIGEGYEKQDASNFFPDTGKRRRHGFIVAYNKQVGTATICDAYYPKGSEEEVNLERKKVVLTNSGWDERMKG